MLSAPPLGDAWLQGSTQHPAKPAMTLMQKGQLLFPFQL